MLGNLEKKRYYYTDKEYTEKFDNRVLNDNEENMLEQLMTLIREFCKKVYDNEDVDLFLEDFLEVSYSDDCGYYLIIDADRGHRDVINLGSNIDEAFKNIVIMVLQSRSIYYESANREKLKQDWSKRFGDIEYFSCLYFAEYALKHWHEYYPMGVPEDIIGYYANYLNGIHSKKIYEIDWYSFLKQRYGCNNIFNQLGDRMYKRILKDLEAEEGYEAPDKYRTYSSADFSPCNRCSQSYGVIRVEDRIELLEKSPMITFNDINMAQADNGNVYDRNNSLYFPISDYYPTCLESLKKIFRDKAVHPGIKSNSNEKKYIPLIGATLGQLPNEFEGLAHIFLIISPSCNAVKTISVPNAFVWEQLQDKQTQNMYSYGSFSRYDYRVEGKIDLSMIKAIGISIERIKRRADFNLNSWMSPYLNNFSGDEIILEGLMEDIKVKYQNDILELMNEYGISLPIVDVSNGKPIVIAPKNLMLESTDKLLRERNGEHVRKKILERLGK